MGMSQPAEGADSASFALALWCAPPRPHKPDMPILPPPHRCEPEDPRSHRSMFVWMFLVSWVGVCTSLLSSSFSVACVLCLFTSFPRGGKSIVLSFYCLRCTGWMFGAIRPRAWEIVPHLTKGEQATFPVVPCLVSSPLVLRWMGIMVQWHGVTILQCSNGTTASCTEAMLQPRPANSVAEGPTPIPSPLFFVFLLVSLRSPA